MRRFDWCPDERHCAGQKEGRGQRGIGDRGRGSVMMADMARDNLAYGEQDGRNKGKDQPGMKARETGADHHQRAEKADHRGGPAVRAYTFSQDKRAEDCHNQRRDESHSDRIGKGDVIQPDDEQCRRHRGRHTPRQLERAMPGFHDDEAAEPDQEDHAQKQPQIARPDNLQRRQVIGRILGHRIDGGKDEHAGEHEERAAQIIGPARLGRPQGLAVSLDCHHPQSAHKSSQKAPVSMPACGWVWTEGA